MNKKLPVYKITAEEVEKVEITHKDIWDLFWGGSMDSSDGLFDRIVQEKIRDDRDQKLSDLGIE